MTKVKIGDTQKAVCNDCKAIKNVTYQIRNVPFSDNSGIAENILVGVCDSCDSVVVLPNQSTPLVKHSLILILSGVNEDTKGLEDAIFEAGCDDALLFFKNNTACLEFDSAKTQTHLEKLKNRIQSLIPDIDNIEIDLDSPLEDDDQVVENEKSADM